MKTTRRFITLIVALALISLACQTVTGLSQTPTPLPTATLAPTSAPTASNTPTSLPAPSGSQEIDPNEPVFISGDIPYTSPFFLNTISEPFILLEDEAGFVQRNKEFEFPLKEQVLGAVVVHQDQSLTYTLSLPAAPQATFVDVDNNGNNDTGVQVFAIAYWSNTWGDPFLEPRDGTGWSTAYASTITDPERDDEITGGTLLIWAPDEQQGFPTGFGPDGKLFTEDDPTAPIPAGYNIVDLNQEPFSIYKEAKPQITLNEGAVAVNDYSKMSYSDAFEAMFDKVSREYPFTQEKGIDWQAIHDEFAPRVADATNAKDFYRAIRDFTYAIPDAHVGVSLNPEVFFEEEGGGFGLVLAELSDGRVIVTKVLPNDPGAQAGIEVGAEIITWDGKPVSEAIDGVTPYLGPFSTEQHKRLEQVIFLTRVPPDTEVTVTYKNPGDAQSKQVTMEAAVEYDSLFAALPTFNFDELLLPVEGKVLDDSGLGYIRITTFSDDYRMIASLWDRYIHNLVDNQIPGLIIDLRVNSGGSGGLTRDFAGYLFDKEFTFSRESYYNELTGKFEDTGYPTEIKPGPVVYDGPVAVLVSPDCISACEGFAGEMTHDSRAIIVGNYPTAGAFGEVGRGQYKLPEDLSLQFPTGRPESPDGKVLIEGKGVPLDITVPVTADGALGKEDTVLQAAVQALEDQIK
ncbi:MAG: S41 family peptidase [Anaerolineales bacterium]